MGDKLFCEETVSELIKRYNAEPEGWRKDDLMNQVWQSTRAIRDLLISKCYVTGCDHQDIHSILLVKFCKILKRYKPESGRAYSFFFMAFQRTIWSAIGKGRRSLGHISYLGDQAALADLEYKASRNKNREEA